MKSRPSGPRRPRITVATKRFVQFIEAAKITPYPHLNELGWLLENFRFGDRFCEFSPPPAHMQEITLGPAEMMLLWRISKNRG